MVNELTTLLAEEKQIRASLGRLRTRKQALEQSIKKYLSETEDPGIKFKDMTISVHDKEIRLYKNKTSKIDDAKNALKSHGVSNADSVLASVIEAMRGDTRTEQKLLVKKTK